MVSRLYGTTRGLYQAIESALTRVQSSDLGSPTLRALIALYGTGLVLLDVRQTHIRVTDTLPARGHDALNRLLRVMPLSTRRVMRLLMGLVQRLGVAGYLCLDDVIIEKAYARRLPWAAWTYSFAKKRKVYGLHVIVVLWGSHDGQWRMPVGFRLWRPKCTCTPQRYQTKPELALTLLREVQAARVPSDYVAFDTHYTTGKNTRALTRMGVTWHGTRSPRTIVCWRGQRLAVRDLAPRLKLRWRTQGLLIIDDTTLDKPSAQQMALVHRHWSGKHRRVVKGINLVSLVWSDGTHAVPCDYRLFDAPNDGKTKNDHFRAMLQTAKDRGFAPSDVCFDGWYSSLDNLKRLRTLNWAWLTRLQANRLVNPDGHGNRPLSACDICDRGTRVHWIRLRVYPGISDRYPRR